MVEVLCATLSGMPFGPHITSMYGASIKRKRNLGQFYIVFRNDVNIESDQFKEALKLMTNEVRLEQGNDLGDNVQMPNDPQIKVHKDREKNGIPVMKNVLDILF